jgi:hypothetical protein
VNSARYVRATITNTSEQNDICLDEFAVWGGSAASSAHLIDAFCGYVGNSVDLYNHDGTIKIQFEDVRKKENDNRQVELTADYRNKRPEQIIWDLLTNPSYWAQSTEVTLGENILLNPSFESGFTNWTLPSHYGYGVVSPAIVTDKVRTGTKSVGMNPNDAQYPGMGSTWTYKQTIACKSNRRYQ